MASVNEINSRLVPWLKWPIKHMSRDTNVAFDNSDLFDPTLTLTYDWYKVYAHRVPSHIFGNSFYEIFFAGVI